MISQRGDDVLKVMTCMSHHLHDMRQELLQSDQRLQRASTPTELPCCPLLPSPYQGRQQAHYHWYYKVSACGGAPSAFMTVSLIEI